MPQKDRVLVLMPKESDLQNSSSWSTNDGRLTLMQKELFILMAKDELNESWRSKGMFSPKV